MTSDAFTAWLAEMKSAGLAKSDAECARLLNLTPHAIVKMKRRGCDTRTALACSALLHRLRAYG